MPTLVPLNLAERRPQTAAEGSRTDKLQRTVRGYLERRAFFKDCLSKAAPTEEKYAETTDKFYR
jgi:hypothetical protein